MPRPFKLKYVCLLIIHSSLLIITGDAHLTVYVTMGKFFLLPVKSLSRPATTSPLETCFTS